MNHRIGNERVRFLRHFVKGSKNACWLWEGATAQGYGILMGDDRKIKGAHRLAWQIENNKAVPKGKEVCHSCDTPRCVNSAHLFLGTHADNMKDCKIKNRRPLLEGERNGNAKLTNRMVQEMRRKYRQGFKICEIARNYEMDRNHVSSIVHNKVWTHVH